MNLKLDRMTVYCCKHGNRGSRGKTAKKSVLYTGEDTKTIKINKRSYIVSPGKRMTIRGGDAQVLLSLPDFVEG